MTDRIRKLEYIKEDGGEANVHRRVISMLTKHGSDWLTDEQIDEMFDAEARFHEMRERVNAVNREVAETARRGRDEAAA